MSTPFRVAYVPGVTPGKWVKAWGQRMPRSPLEVRLVDEKAQREVLYDGTADMSFVRLPVDRDGLHVIPLYLERPVVVVPKEHAATAYTEVSDSDLDGEIRLQVSDSLTAKQAIETVAAGTGVVVVPMSVARLHHRKDADYVPVSDLPETQIALAWRADVEDARFEEFVGVVRGRSERSSRGQQPAAKEPPRKAATKPANKAAKKAGKPARRRGRGRR